MPSKTSQGNFPADRLRFGFWIASFWKARVHHKNLVRWTSPSGNNWDCQNIHSQAWFTWKLMVGRRSLPFRMAYFRDELLVSGRVPSQSLTCFTWKWHTRIGDSELGNHHFGFLINLGSFVPWTQQVICASLGHLPQQCQGLFFVECCFCLQFHLFKNSIKNQFGWWNMMVFHQDWRRILGFKNSARRISRLQVLRRTAGPAARLGSYGVPWGVFHDTVHRIP